MTKISSFVNNDGVMVHAAFVTVEVRSNFGFGDKKLIEQHQGTFSSYAEAERRIKAVQDGTHRDEGVE
ncbi:hypothetical protein GOL87_26845 [Sinorhizobium medicae]|nr:hypothetical protein [Sinorhizobium medicae]MDX0924576.1 hypothetical protein [Sinorhizobium medicae]MDX1026884.1 hypothetical protein [Sinorhizobium medicae]MDX1094908.1 hypothetical protein [Sinorhizobium medicae]MDX1138629.1 hypothetical protein [Sinorhizobium medicae]